MLPASASTDSWKAADNSLSTRYGNVAMEHLINDILKNGGKRQNLEARIFGGGRIIANMTDAGSRNIAFARDYLETEGLKITSEDVGDTFPRTVVYFPATGKVRVKRLRSLHNNTIVELETSTSILSRKNRLAAISSCFEFGAPVQTCLGTGRKKQKSHTGAQ
jgi:chemotaxis protein CheD